MNLVSSAALAVAGRIKRGQQLAVRTGDVIVDIAVWQRWPLGGGEAEAGCDGDADHGWAGNVALISHVEIASGLTEMKWP